MLDYTAVYDGHYFLVPPSRGRTSLSYLVAYLFLGMQSGKQNRDSMTVKIDKMRQGGCETVTVWGGVARTISSMQFMIVSVMCAG